VENNIEIVFSCDGLVKHVEKPLESDEFSVILQHDKEIEAIFVDEDLRFYCGESIDL
jgi:hypothetical protein